ncbi:MAG: C39 family peptidase [Candidatus Abawacabacteria bacterium]|nr:C39 family peptidase [Candidatus Abawacabacteria bacterium]
MPKSYIQNGVPYFAQWESKELADDILKKRILAVNDPKWLASGAESPEEYALWSWNACGMACLKMVLAYYKKVTIPLVTLCKQCVKYGGYTFPLETSPGLYYGPFVNFVRQTYGLQAKVIYPMILKEIVQALAKQKLVIASVAPEIRNPSAISTKRGGHLVLIVGFDAQQKIIYLHNPSGNTPESQEYAQISFNDFKKFFANKGIIIH